MTKPEAQRVGRGGIEGAGINETTPSLLLFLPSLVIGKTAPRGTPNNPVVLEGQWFLKLFLLNATKVFFGGGGASWWGGRNGNPLVFLPEKAHVDRGAWWAAAAESRTRLSTFSVGGEGC